MKSLLYKVSVPLIGLLLVTDPVYTQGKVELGGGFGTPELLAFKVRYGQKLQIGASQGIGIFTMFSQTQVIHGPTMAEIYYHFYGKSRFTEIPPWYFLGSAGYYIGLNVFLIGPRIGRSFNFSEKAGINIDAGAIFMLEKSYIESGHSPLFMSGSICFFFKL